MVIFHCSLLILVLLVHASHLLLFVTTVQPFPAILLPRSNQKPATTLRLWATRPVVVVVAPWQREAAQAATLGAALGLSVRDVLSQQPSTHPAVEQPVALLTTSSLKDYERVRYSNNHRQQQEDDDDEDEPILHVVLDVDDDADPALLLLTSRVLRKSISFLGLHPVAPKKGAATAGKAAVVVPPDTARNMGTALQRILDPFYNLNTPTMMIAWDWSLHLAMLQANCLPKSHAPHGRDSYLILPSSLDDDDDMVVVVDYLYDYNNPFGGTDPLSCPTREVTVAPPASSESNSEPWTGAARHGAAAAYTALRGNGADAVQAACIASSVGATIVAMMAGGGDVGGWDSPDVMGSAGSFIDPSVIERAAQLARQLRDERVTTGPVVRQKYIEFGYK